MAKKFKYDLRGVSATKDEVHEAIKNLDKGLYPKAFCKILPDIVGGDSDYCNLMHADTAGTKPSIAYMYWKETGDLSVWKGIAQDAIVMNIDDMLCVGCFDNIVLSSTIGRNKNLISGEVIQTLIEETVRFTDLLKDFGVNISLAGGETADVGDVVRTVDVGYTAFARMKRADVIDCKIQDGDVIVGLASYGQATYETEYNGGMGSNGLTSAKHDVLSFYHAEKYPDSYDQNIDKSVVFLGSKKLTDTIKIDAENTMTIGKLILSPTRTFSPVIKKILEKLQTKINAIIHNTGGAHSKVLKFVDGKHIVKNNLLPVPPLFELIHRESGASLEEMYQVFNMGTRLEIYLPQEFAEDVIHISKSFNIDAQIIGFVEDNLENQVTIKNKGKTITYK